MPSFPHTLSGLESRGYPLWQLCEDYLRVKPLVHNVVHIGTESKDARNVIVINGSKRHDTSPVATPFIVTAIKIISYFCIILPIIAYVYSSYMRRQFDFQLNNAASTNPSDSSVDGSNDTQKATPPSIWDQRYTLRVPPGKMTIKVEGKTLKLAQSDEDNTPFKVIKRWEGTTSMYHKIRDFFATHFMIKKKIVREVIYCKETVIKPVAMAAYLEMQKVLTLKKGQQSALEEVEASLKDALKKELEVTDEMSSPVSMKSWNEIPLRKILYMTRDKSFYGMGNEPEDLDFLYLKQQFLESNKWISPVNRQLFTDQDYKNFITKGKQLDLFSSQELKGIIKPTAKSDVESADEDYYSTDEEDYEAYLSAEEADDSGSQVNPQETVA